ncbi:hypothetical protein K457DRAFT_888083 [Linnemannia elongata AG-77]|uniref:F-box domain-containing protein n=1 Tax=Linnemannia elongata AG-77 TaxID=1314771 RepID=A0A197JEM7_9FUNG|nr:hypothetical protein K457DRAFT_888083 [Linnemannia elongata AG-77]
MSSAASQFFASLELVALLATHLHCKALSRLARTSRCMRVRFAPHLYRELIIGYGPYRRRPFTSPEAIMALSQNADHVRELAMDVLSLVYYMNGLVVFNDLQARSTGRSISQPRWVALPDPRSCLVLPILPITLLTKLTIHTWLSELRKLDVIAYFWEGYQQKPFSLCTTIVLFCPLRLQELKLTIFPKDFSQDQDLLKEYREVPPGFLHSWEQQEGERGELCVELQDATEFPWVCTGLTELVLTIGIPDTPLHHHEGSDPYYVRAAPVVLSEAKRHQFGKLERLYERIGSLTQLRILNLRVFYFDPTGVRALSKFYRRNSFPGLLSLGDVASGRPGCGNIAKTCQVRPPPPVTGASPPDVENP